MINCGSMIKNSSAGPFWQAIRHGGGGCDTGCSCTLVSPLAPLQDAIHEKQRVANRAQRALDSQQASTMARDNVLSVHHDKGSRLAEHADEPRRSFQLLVANWLRWGVGDAVGRPVPGRRSRYGAGIDGSVINDAGCMSYASHGDQGLSALCAVGCGICTRCLFPEHPRRRIVVERGAWVAGGGSIRRR